MKREPLGLVLILVCIFGVSTTSIAAADDRDQPSQPGQRLVVKFSDSLRARALPDGSLRLGGNAEHVGLENLRTSRGLSFEALIQLPERVLDNLEGRAAAVSGREQPDLAGLMIVHPRIGDEPDLYELGATLEALPEIEFAHVQRVGVPPPADIPPTTPDLTSYQTYHGPDPGIDAAHAWSVNARGAGIRLSDCEYGWNHAHEDLEDIDLHPEPGQTPHPDVASYDWDDHGTAVVGETSGVVNGYGVSGLVPDAEVYTYPEWTIEGGYRRATAITNAIAGSSPGDVVLLEMQDIDDNFDYVPAEWDPAVWAVVRTGTDAGVIVVGAAGNGGADLDDTSHVNYMQRGDSGAILVGAGTPDVNHNTYSWSTFGSRIDLQGWGGGVFTTGYGDFATYGGDENQEYTDTFGGTSSASPIVASACVAVQSHRLANGLDPMRPRQLRALLVLTGVPQGSGGHIGPLPDLGEALPASLEWVFADGFESGDDIAWSSGVQ